MHSLLFYLLTSLLCLISTFIANVVLINCDGIGNGDIYDIVRADVNIPEPTSAEFITVLLQHCFNVRINGNFITLSNSMNLFSFSQIGYQTLKRDQSTARLFPT